MYAELCEIISHCEYRMRSVRNTVEHCVISHTYMREHLGMSYAEMREMATGYTDDDPDNMPQD